LAELFLRNLSKRHRLTGKSISSAGRKNLMSYAWPGNVRELAHELERAIVFEDVNQLDFENLMSRSTAMILPLESGKTDLGDWFNNGYVFPSEGFSLEEAILRIISHALKQTNQNVSAAARLLGVSRDYLRYRLAGRTGSEVPNNQTESGEIVAEKTGE
jgi:DNA-binding NtrC family response regulator